tara:strand:+ start:820 stop:1386 length:567 start_codon:yes stop_codon:yes gene_type:complete
MDMRLGIEPLHVIERRHIEKAIKACNGKVPYAAELLEVGRSTIYRKMAEWTNGNVRKVTEAMQRTLDWSVLEPPRLGALQRRRNVEEAIENSGGSIRHAGECLGVTVACINYSLQCWHKDNERLIRSKARSEGISDDEIEVMLRRRTIDEHAQRNGFSITTSYKMIDEACALVGLRRYRNWLFLCAES